nr:hypothetical protein OH820_23255 [Streptomyces sp. NBC_00857]
MPAAVRCLPLRTAWLMACDQVEHELAAVIATRLGLKPDDLQVGLHAAAAAAALRVIDEYVGAGLLDGADPRKLGDGSFAFIADAVACGPRSPAVGMSGSYASATTARDGAFAS